MKKILLFLLVFLNVAYAENDTLSPYPQAKEGINIWSMAKVNPNHTVHPLASGEYIDTDETNDAVSFLLNLPKISRQEVHQYENVTDDSDTHLKSSISKLHLNFNFKGIPSINKSAVIGYSVAGTYTSAGWNGAAEFADLKDMGICSFTRLKIEKVILAKEGISFAVNGKPGEKSILGNYTAGFMYNVNWYTNSKRYSFQCANSKYDYKIIDRMMGISNSIDRVNN